MAVQFIGNCEWDVALDPIWTAGGFEADRVKIVYRGRRDKKTAFENSIVRFQALAGFPLMRLENWADSGGTENLPAIDLSYIGLRYGIPPAKRNNSTTLQSVTSSGLDTSVGGITSGLIVSGTVYFKCTRTTWTWYETSLPPKAPRFDSVYDFAQPSIVGYSLSIPRNGDPQSPVGLYSAPVSALAAVTDHLAAQQSVSDYNTEEIIPNALYACSSSIDYKLVSDA